MKILEHRTLYRDGEYVAFPNLAFLPDGRLMCAFRHAKERQKEFGRVTHVDPTAKDVYILSEDNGKTFSPELHVIIVMNIQDPCQLCVRTRIIVTFFRCRGPIGWGTTHWRKVFKRLPYLHGKYDCFTDGASYSISDDCGKTWRHMPVISPEGYLKGTAIRGNLVELDDGTLLLPFYGSKNPGELSRAGLLRSDDRGESWYYYSEMAYDSQGEKNFLEPGIYRTESGRIIGLFRTQTDFLKKGVDFEQTYLNLHMSVSEDDGKTFGPVFEADTLWGSSPFHALRLKSGKVLVTYGYRRKPFGIRARLCNGELSDLNEAPEMILRDDAPNGDLGYPHSIQLPDGTIMVSYYISGDDGIRKIDATLLAE